MNTWSSKAGAAGLTVGEKQMAQSPAFLLKQISVILIAQMGYCKNMELYVQLCCYAPETLKIDLQMFKSDQT